MSSITEALALYDTANQVDRLNFQLRALNRGPAIPSLSEVSSYVHTLAEITLSVSEQVKHRSAQIRRISFPQKEKLARGPVFPAVSRTGT
ncbi:hypothetical protein [Actinacidiphila sp. bgisy144]|uniref:hypothetical protein n=1 Tax=unclassified Actinacidiphila TaxID=2995708 RepID=UPI003EC0B63D